MRLGSKLLRLWCRPAAVALVEPLAWKIPYAIGAALKRKKIKDKATEVSKFLRIRIYREVVLFLAPPVACRSSGTKELLQQRLKPQP